MTQLWHKVGVLPTKIDAGNVHMAFPQGHDPENITNPYIRKAIEEIEKFTGGKAVGLMVNTLDPLTSSPIHTDPGTAQRYHLPLRTNRDVKWWDEVNGMIYMMTGWWYGPIPYHLKHKVINDHSTDSRVHLIVDIEQPPSALNEKQS